MINFTIDGKLVSVPKGTTVYQAAKQNGVEIPIFCYQDRMPPFGACRVCLVEVEKMGKLQTSCSLEATEGMVVKTQSQMAEDGRKGILELLLINHPLDCPICDKGGECPLQDQTVKYGPGLSRFFEEKRRMDKHHALGPVLMLDRERCIACARCTRFGDIVAGDHALEFKERGFRAEVGTPNDQPVESKFIGNTIAICPVGALTSQVYRFRARPWDNTSVKTTCTLCPVGCSETIDSRDGEIMRTRSCENSHTNDIWLCDKGWFGYEFITHPDRLKHPLIRENGNLRKASWEEAIYLIANKISQAKPNKKLAGFGGNPLTVEENYLFQALMREGALVDHVDHRIGMSSISLDKEGIAPGMEIPISECENLSSIIFLGCDLTEEFPVIWLRLKQAINKGASSLFLGHYLPEIAPHLTKTILHAPGKEIDLLKQYLPYLKEQAEKGNTAIFIGSQYLNTKDRRQILLSLLPLKEQYPTLSLNVLEGKGNSMGARFAGMHPHAGENQGLSAYEVIEAASKESWDYLHVAGANPAINFASETWKKARKNINFLVVQDLFLNETAKEADVVLPTLCFVEKTGSFINIAKRIEKINPAITPPPDVYSDGEIFVQIAIKLGIDLKLSPSLVKILESNRLSQSFFHNNRSYNTITEATTSNQHHDLSASFKNVLFDQGTRMQHNSHLLKQVKPPKIRLHPLEGIKRGIVENDVIKIKINGAIISAQVHFDENVAAQTVVIPLGFPSLKAFDLEERLVNGQVVEIFK